MNCQYIQNIPEKAPAIIGEFTKFKRTQDAAAFPKKGDYTVITIDATALALDILGRPITNVPMLAALVAAAGTVNSDSVLKAIDDQLAPRIREKNKALFTAAYDKVKGEL